MCVLRTFGSDPMQLTLPEDVNLSTIPGIVSEVDKLLKTPAGGDLFVDFSMVRQFNMSGFGMLLRLQKRCKSMGISVKFLNISEDLSQLYAFANFDEAVDQKTKRPEVRGFFEKIGRNVVWYLRDFLEIMEFLGRIYSQLLKELFLPKRILWKDTLYYIEMTGVNAIPIVGLISFLLGMIIAFQASDQLAYFGANIFVVELVSLSMTRELAPLITAIIVAGRSGSAFTAEIGTMKVSEEIDAMTVMGLNLTNYLISPKFWALLISLPLLAFWADITSLIGGALIADLKLDVSYFHFIARLQEKLAIRHVLLGIGKCYVFAAIIAFVGCYRGFKVSSGAASVGRQTTSSVVTSIFFVIIADAGLSVIFTILDI